MGVIDNRTVIEQEYVEKTINAIEEVERISFQQLRTSARTFLETVRSVLQLQSHSEVLYKRLYHIQNKTNLLYKDMRSSTDVTQKIVLAEKIFSKELDKYLGRHIYLTYVTKEGDIIAANDMQTEKMIGASTANKGRANISEHAALNALGIDSVNEDALNINNQIRKANESKKEVYKAAIQRYGKTENNKGQWVTNKGHTKEFYWYTRIDKKRTYSIRFGNKGRIAEDYANLVLNEDPNINNNMIEESLRYLSSRHGKEDNISALLKGDVQINKENANIEFAIKQGSFSTSRVGQSINLAYNIAYLIPETGPKDLKEQLPNLINKESVTKGIERALQEEVSFIEKEILKEWQSLK